MLRLGLFSHRFADARDTMGDVGLYGNTTFLVAGLGVSVSGKLKPNLRLSTAVAVSAVGYMIESIDTLGDMGAPGLTYWTAFVAWQINSDWQTDVGFAARESTIKISGPGTARVTPRPDDADLNFLSGEVFARLVRRL